jgi:hypothetical protein
MRRSARLAIALSAAAALLPFAAARAQGTFKAVPRAAAPDRCRAHRFCVRRAAGAPAVAGFGQFTATGPIVGSPRSGPRRAAGPAAPPAVPHVEVSLDHGKGFDAGFASWASAGAAAPPGDIVVDVMNEAGQRVSTRHFTQCRPMQYQGVPNLDAGAFEVAIAHLKLRCGT